MRRPLQIPVRVLLCLIANRTWMPPNQVQTALFPHNHRAEDGVFFMATTNEIKQLRTALQQELMATTNEIEQLRRALQQERRLREEERRLREQAEQDAAATRAALLREREEHSRMTLGKPTLTSRLTHGCTMLTAKDQPLNDYLGRIHLLNFHMSRLLPRPGTAIRTLSEGRRSRSTTRGRTDIVNKYYPLRIRAWADFPGLCQEYFARIRDALGSRRLFPSAAEVDFTEKRLVELTPEGFMESESSLNEDRSSAFLHETLEMPVQRILNAYLGASGHEEKLYFDCHSAGWLMRSDSGSVSISSASRRSSNSSHSSSSSSSAKTSTGQRSKIRPDCLALCLETPSSAADPAGAPGGGVEGADMEDAENPSRSVYRVTLGEHKAIHRLRAALVSRYLETPVAEDFLVQLARKASSGQPVPGVTRDTAGRVEGSSSTNIPGHMFFIYALTQTFHYMVTSGLEFAYVATGETLSFLRAPRDDPTTLLYHTEVFPQYCHPDRGNADADSADNAIIVDQLAISKLCSLALLAFESTAASARCRSIHISQLALFPNLPPSLADESATSSPTEPRSRDSSQGRRRRRDERDDDDDDEGDDDGDGPRMGGGPRLTAAHRPRNPSPLKQQPLTPGHERSDARSHVYAKANTSRVYRARRPVRGLKPGRGRFPPLPSLPGPFDPVSFKPIRPFCTHMCLRGLVRGDGIDYDCPNVLLHLEAVRRIGLPDRAGHAIGLDGLVELVKGQLFDNAERDCECLSERGLEGAIGCLFKLTVTGYGYTLVAKGVQAFYAKRIRHEARVYKKLEAQQGILIPVCLGVAELSLPYSFDFKLITHMLLLSYAGMPLYSSRLRRQLDACHIDLEAEESRTLKELRALGLEDHDIESNGNLTWCPSTCRVMKIDFDQALVREDSIMTARKRAADDSPRRDGSPKRRRQNRPQHSTVASLLLA